MVRVAIISLLTLAVSAYAALDPSELKNVGAGNGKQFITGKCLSNADCSTACCAEKNGAGVCSAVSVAEADGKTGCGFVGGNNGVFDRAINGGNGGNAVNNGGNAGNGGNGAVATGDGAQNFGNGAGKQFITGVCASDADCQSQCCAVTTQACAAIGAVGKENCGFVA